MSSRNDITNDPIKSRAGNKKFFSRFDMAFDTANFRKDVIPQIAESTDKTEEELAELSTKDLWDLYEKEVLTDN